MEPPFDYTEKADVYSFGILCWEMMTGERAFSEVKIFDIPQLVLSGKRPKISSDCNQELAKLIQDCWRVFFKVIYVTFLA